MSTTTTMPPSHVHIVGAGLGGLTLARILQLSNILVTVYERETDPVSRAQGGTLDMHTQTGQKALRLAKLHDKFEEQCSRLADTMMIRGKDGVIVWQDEPHEGGPPGGGLPDDNEDHDGPLDGDRPEIDRGILRKILLDSLEPGTVQWGHTLRSITPTATGMHRLVVETANSTFKTFVAEFVVGADGAWSKMRPILTPAVPAYTGVTFVETELHDVDSQYPEIAQLVGDGTMSAIQDSKGIIVQRNSGGKCKVYLAFRVAQSWASVDSGIPFDSDAETTRARLVGLFEGWSEGLLNVLRVAEPNFIPRPLFAMDPETRWETKEGITLLGDAAHVMSPFAGEGANLAMIDAAELGYALAGKNLSGEEASTSVTRAVAAFESRMFKRAKPAAEESARNLDLFISDQAPFAVAEMMKEMMSRGPPPS